MQLKNLEVKRAHGTVTDRQGSRLLTESEIIALGECRGELREGGTKWVMEFGEHRDWFCVVAEVEPEVTDPAFESPLHPVDVCGVPVQSGTYSVCLDKSFRSVEVYEADDGEYWVKPFHASKTDRPWRLAEMSRECKWEPIGRLIPKESY